MCTQNKSKREEKNQYNQHLLATHQNTEKRVKRYMCETNDEPMKEIIKIITLN